MRNRTRFFILAPLITGGMAVLGYVGVKTLLNLKPDPNKDFFNWTGPAAKQRQVGSVQVDLPIFYYRDDCFLGIFSADYRAVRAILPTRELYPATLPNGRAMVLIMALNYLDTSIGPYGEAGICIPCTYQRPFLPLSSWLLKGRPPTLGMFVLHLPVTSLMARNIGRAIWGYPKFVADMEFQKQPEVQCLYLSENNAPILTLKVRQKGILIKDNQPIINYTTLDRNLIKTTVSTRSVYQLGLTPGSGELTLGEHPIADQLRRLDISTSTRFTRNYLSRYSILPLGEIAGRVEQPYPGYIGEERLFGRLTTINYRKPYPGRA